MIFLETECPLMSHHYDIEYQSMPPRTRHLGYNISISLIGGRLGVFVGLSVCIPCLYNYIEVAIHFYTWLEVRWTALKVYGLFRSVFMLTHYYLLTYTDFFYNKYIGLSLLSLYLISKIWNWPYLMLCTLNVSLEILTHFQWDTEFGNLMLTNFPNNSTHTIKLVNLIIQRDSIKWNIKNIEPWSKYTVSYKKKWM